MANNMKMMMMIYYICKGFVNDMQYYKLAKHISTHFPLKYLCNWICVVKHCLNSLNRLQCGFNILLHLFTLIFNNILLYDFRLVLASFGLNKMSQSQTWYEWRMWHDAYQSITNGEWRISFIRDICKESLFCIAIVIC